MIVQAPIEAFISDYKEWPIMDVRSPGEFAQGHITGAFNIPLFTNEERAEIGTLYKLKGKESAVDRGLEIVGLKMLDYVKYSRQIAPSGNIRIHCWRGGMRSNSMAWLLSTAGFKNCVVLEKGYKAFRNKALTAFENQYPIVVLGGRTGSAKTEILHELRDLGQQVIDLEALANHKGSAFGGLGQPSQPTTEQFENDLFSALNNLSLDKPIWIEDESSLIGSVKIPAPFHIAKQNAAVICVNIPIEERIEFLVSNYSQVGDELLEASIRKVTKRLGPQHAQEALLELSRKNYKRVAEKLLIYYDKAYDYMLSQRRIDQVIHMNFNKINPKIIAEQIIKELDKLPINDH